MFRLTTNLLRMNTAQQTSDRITAVVAEAMKAQKHSQRSMADAIGMPLVTLNRRLNGKSAFSVPELAAIAHELNISLLEIALRAERLAEPSAA